MSDNQNDNQNSGTIKPIAQKSSSKPLRTQTEGYHKDEIIEQNSVLQSKPTLSLKPFLKLSASVYIPKSLASNNANLSDAANTVSDKQAQSSASPNVQNNTILNTITQPFTPKMNNYNSNLNINTSINPIGQSYNMGYSKVFFILIKIFLSFFEKIK